MRWQQILGSAGMVPSNEAFGNVAVPMVMGCNIAYYLDWWVLDL